jgi:hypothetical protein
VTDVSRFSVYTHAFPWAINALDNLSQHLREALSFPKQINDRTVRHGTCDAREFERSDEFPELPNQIRPMK